MIRLHQNLNTPTITIFSIYYTVPNVQTAAPAMTSCNCPLCRNWPGRRGGTAQANSYIVLLYMQGTCWRLGSSYFPLTTSIEVTTHERKPSKQQERQK